VTCTGCATCRPAPGDLGTRPCGDLPLPAVLESSSAMLAGSVAAHFERGVMWSKKNRMHVTCGSIFKHAHSLTHARTHSSACRSSTLLARLKKAWRSCSAKRKCKSYFWVPAVQTLTGTPSRRSHSPQVGQTQPFPLAPASTPTPLSSLVTTSTATVPSGLLGRHLTSNCRCCLLHTRRTAHSPAGSMRC
jgi:hypothetical protein